MSQFTWIYYQTKMVILYKLLHINPDILECLNKKLSVDSVNNNSNQLYKHKDILWWQ